VQVLQSLERLANPTSHQECYLMNTRARVAAAGLLCGSLSFGLANQAGTAEPGFFHEELDNAQGQVVRINIPPHPQKPHHEVSARVIVWLTDAHLRMRFPDGSTREESHHRGEVGWTAGSRHSGENLGARPIEFVAVVPKRSGP